MLLKSELSLKNLISIVLLSILLSCEGEKTNESLSFELIDVSMYNGWTDYYCMKVFKDGRIYIFNNNFKKGDSYYKVNVGKIELDSISFLTDKVLATKFDTLYHSRCADCGAYCLIIKTQSKEFSSLVDGINPSNEHLKPMDDLIAYLSKIAVASKSSIDSIFVFKSRTRQFYPPPPPPDEIVDSLK